MALAIEQPHIAVTLLPLACTGATISAGMFDSQRADDCPWVAGIDSCSGRSPAQFDELKDIMAQVRRQQPQRLLDMVLLTIGANDINFAGLVANVIVEAATERLLLRQGGSIISVKDAQSGLDDDLPGAFCPLAHRTRTYVGNSLSRVVFTSYANPAMLAENKPCPGGRDGLDVHPAFSADKDRLRAAAELVDGKFLIEDLDSSNVRRQ